MSRNTGYALLAGLLALVVVVSGALFVGFGGAPEGTRATAGGSRSPAAPASSGSWVGTWASSPAAAEPDSEDGYPDMSIRNVVHTSVGGSAARIQLSNLFGDQPLTIGAATLALASEPSTPIAAAGSMRRLTFGTQESVTIPPGGVVTSDAVRLNVPQAADLLVTTYASGPSGPVTYHPFARQTSFLAAGDRTGQVEGDAFTEETPYWRYLSGVDVWSHEADGAVVVIGDSITDGITSSTGANRRWTDFLAARLRTERGAPRYSVLNQGISGNRVLVDGNPDSPSNGPSAVSRLDRDVLSRTGVRTVVIQLGINDIIKLPQQDDAGLIVAGLEQLAGESRGRGLRVVATTLTPFGGYAKHTPEREAVRTEVNRRIRASEAFDAVVDLDAALSDPEHPERLRAAYDSGDHLHPSDHGFRAMADAVALAELRASTAARL